MAKKDDFVIERVTQLEIWVRHKPSDDLFEFKLSGGDDPLGGHRPVYVPGSTRHDPDDPAIDELERTARRVALDHLRDKK